MEIRFNSADHDTKAPNYRVRWYNDASIVVKESLFAFQQVGTVSGSAPPLYRLLNVPKPTPPHTSDYRITVQAESTVGNSGESPMSASFSLSPPATPEHVIVVDPLL
jgi:hypothetical protein